MFRNGTSRYALVCLIPATYVDFQSFLPVVSLDANVDIGGALRRESGVIYGIEGHWPGIRSNSCNVSEGDIRSKCEETWFGEILAPWKIQSHRRS